MIKVWQVSSTAATLCCLREDLGDWLTFTLWHIKSDCRVGFVTMNTDHSKSCTSVSTAGNYFLQCVVILNNQKHRPCTGRAGLKRKIRWQNAA